MSRIICDKCGSDKLNFIASFQTTELRHIPESTIPQTLIGGLWLHCTMYQCLDCKEIKVDKQ